MRNRHNRLDTISDILSTQSISSQDALAKQLAQRGYIVTQATLSRDLKKLGTIKVASDLGGYRYIVDSADPQKISGKKSEIAPMTATFQSSLHPAAISVRMSGNILIIKTRNGYASGLAYDLDTMNSPLILGTIPGADTVFAVVDESATRSEIYELLCGFLTPEVLENARSYFS